MFSFFLPFFFIKNEAKLYQFYAIKLEERGEKEKFYTEYKKNIFPANRTTLRSCQTAGGGNFTEISSQMSLFIILSLSYL